MALVTVQRSPSVSSSPQSSVSVLRYLLYTTPVVCTLVQVVPSAALSAASDALRCSPPPSWRVIPLARLHSARSELDRLFYLIWRCTDSRARKGICEKLKVSLHIYIYASRIHVREAVRCDTRDTATGPRSPARKARRNKGTRGVNKRRQVGSSVRSLRIACSPPIHLCRSLPRYHRVVASIANRVPEEIVLLHGFLFTALMLSLSVHTDRH